MGFWKTHRIHGTSIFVPIYIYHKNQANLGKYTIHAMGDDFSSYAGWRCPGEIVRCTTVETIEQQIVFVFFFGEVVTI